MSKTATKKKRVVSFTDTGSTFSQHFPHTHTKKIGQVSTDGWVQA